MGTGSVVSAGESGLPSIRSEGGEPGFGGEAPAPEGVVLWDQPKSVSNTTAYLSTNFFNPANDSYDTYIADDFYNPVPWLIDTIYLPGQVWNGGTDLTCAKSIHVEIYADVGSAPDNFPDGPCCLHPVWTTQLKPNHPAVTLSPGNGGFLTDVTISLTAPIGLPPGRWFLVSYATMDWTAGCGTWGPNVADTTNGHQAVVVNPGGGIGLPTNWTPITDPSAFGIAESDVAFRLEGDIGTNRNGIDVLVSAGVPLGGTWEYFYGGAHWPDLTTSLDVTANSVTVAPDFSNLSYMMGFDALWLDQRGTDSDPTAFLTATEVANIVTFIGTGRPVVMIGENNLWTNWNNQLLGMFGGAFAGDVDGLALPTMSYHPLTWKVHEADIGYGGSANSGIWLFDKSVASVWGPGDNVLILMDVNMVGDNLSPVDNATFMGNIARWVAGEPCLFYHGFESGATTGWVNGLNVECPHDKCDTGGPLGPLCDPCVAQICDVDPFCCNVAWDGICVNQVTTVCGLSCP
jgi:hypothetical protein